MVWAVLTNRLTVGAALAGGIIGTIIFIGVGWTGIVSMTAFFLMGTLATSWKKKTKQVLGLAQENTGRRTIGQVVANAGAGGLLGLFAIFFPQYSSVWLFLVACAFSSATADTVSSELGSVYGKRFYDILSFSNGQRGLDGMISFEGTILGIAGSCIVAAIYSFAQEWNETFLWIVLAGTIGNLADSILGATLERQGIIKNDAVNFLNTAIAVLAGYLFYPF
ncbi:MAG: DUF92 domain-containing protein [Chitinophagaceae bacterium]|nr:MAG: DUF92 domain-containing protein [Chitinophagaceae bacterium]